MIFYRQRQKRLLLIVIVLIIIELFTTYSLKFLSEKINISEREQHEANQAEYWGFIESIITENWQKGIMQATYIAKDMEEDLRDVYGNDKEAYRTDIEMPSLNSAFIQIASNKIEGVYLNYTTNYSYIFNKDSNDLIISTANGVGPDLSEDCATTPEEILAGANPAMRSWDFEYPKHYNKELAMAAQKNIMSGTQINYWEFMVNDNPDHIIITTPTLANLKLVFEAEGLMGLKGYEFLPTVRIMENEDITGVPDVNGLGMENTNHKINVTQGFNLFQQLKAYHSLQIKSYEEKNIDIITSAREARHMIAFIFISISVLTFIAVVFVATIYNHDLQGTRSSDRQ